MRRLLPRSPSVVPLCSLVLALALTRTVGASTPDLSAGLPSQAAREALQNRPHPAAGQALRDALVTSTGPTRAGILDSLAIRREAESVAAIAPYTRDADPLVAEAAIAALGKIGGAQAVAALRAAQAGMAAAHQATLANSLLTCAEQQRLAGDSAAAYVLFSDIYAGSKDDAVRAGAYRGKILTDQGGPSRLIAAGLAGNDRGALLASLQLGGELPGDDVTHGLTDALKSSPPGIQAALIAALVQRQATQAVTAMAALLQSPDPELRMTTREALGILGDAKSIPCMIDGAERASADEQKSICRALCRLRGPEISAALLALLPNAAPAQQDILLESMTSRFDVKAGPGLLVLATSAGEELRLKLFKALEFLGDDAQAGELIRLLKAAQSPSECSQLEKTLVAIALRSSKKEALAKPLMAALDGASRALRISLFNVSARLSGSELRQALQAALADSDAAVQDAAVRALSSLDDVAAWTLLATLAKNSPKLTHRVLAYRGCIRLADAKETSPQDRLQILREIAPLANRTEEKLLFCASVAGSSSFEHLALLAPLLRDEAVKSVARDAYWGMIRNLAFDPDHTRAISGLQGLLEVADGDRKAEVEKLLGEVQARINAK